MPEEARLNSPPRWCLCPKTVHLYRGAGGDDEVKDSGNLVFESVISFPEKGNSL